MMDVQFVSAAFYYSIVSFWFSLLISSFFESYYFYNLYYLLFDNLSSITESTNILYLVATIQICLFSSLQLSVVYITSMIPNPFNYKVESYIKSFCGFGCGLAIYKSFPKFSLLLRNLEKDQVSKFNKSYEMLFGEYKIHKHIREADRTYKKNMDKLKSDYDLMMDNLNDNEKDQEREVTNRQVPFNIFNTLTRGSNRTHGG